MEEKLFKEIEELHSKFHESWDDKKHFNVFTALRPISDEVYLHSRFISSVLDPIGEHGLKKVPLEKFLEEIGSSFKCGENPTVRPNPRVDFWKEEEEIDILIEGVVKDNKDKEGANINGAIIIENKIYAKDSNHPEKGKGQLQGYYHYIQSKHKYRDEQIETYYLTPNRHEPSDYSLHGDKKTFPQLDVESIGNEGKHPCNKKVRCIDYGKEICRWINDVEEIATEHNLKEALKQYEQVVKKLVGDIKLNEKLTQLVSDYFKEAKINWKELCTKEYLGDKVKDIYWHCTADFFFQLEQELLKNNADGISVEIEQRPHPIHEDITYLIKGNHKNQTEKHALYYRVRNKEKGGFWRTIQASPQGFFFGLDNKQMSKTKGWKEIVYFYNPEDSKENQLPLLNLWDFTQGDTFNLLNEDKRKEIAHQYAAFVEQELNKIN